MIIKGIDTYQIDVTTACPLHCDHCYGLKSKMIMKKDTLNRVVNTIIDNINHNDDDEPCITISGGEMGLYNASWLIEALIKIRNEVLPKKPQIVIQTSLIFEINEYHKQLFKLVDEVSTSYDYKIRFKNLSNEILFWNNFNIVKNINSNIQVIITLTKKLLEEVTPQMLFSLILSMGAKHIEIERLCIPMDKIYTFDEIKPLNKDVNDYMFECYKLYKDIQQYYPLIIDTFNCMENSVNGIFCYEHGRKCCQQSLTFSPNGNISTCFMEQDKPFGNVDTNQYDEILRQNVINIEKKVNQQCLKCKYYKYCLGDCHKMSFDESGCPTPTKIYEYIDNNLNN